jgi:hypothetical protein
MKIAVALRSGPNQTNVRSECIIPALIAAGHDVEIVDRAEVVKGADLLIQTGFAGSNALRSQIDARMPYIIMEAPFWRDYYDVHASSSWGYNGLAGGAWAPSPPDEDRPKPELKPMKAGTGPTIIIGQKPTDHSLRGSNHVKWITDVRAEIPEADFRPHPLMVSQGSLEPISEVLRRYVKVVTYTSTVGCEALVEGCQVRADHRTNLAYGVGPGHRGEWHHGLSWRQSTHDSFGALVPYILSGYEEARDRANRGLVEHPREKVRDTAQEQAYYKLLGK